TRPASGVAKPPADGVHARTGQALDAWGRPLLFSCEESMHHELPKLPYALDALRPHISRETLEYHYGKHHATYVEKLNELVAGSDFEDAPLEDIVRFASGPLFNNGAQAWNHDFYWKCLSPKGGGMPSGELAEGLRKSFKTFDAFKSTFTTACENLFGSGWVWLSRT